MSHTDYYPELPGYLVEATSFEEHCLWADYAHTSPRKRVEHPVLWDENLKCTQAEVGQCAGRPVVLQLRFVRVQKRLICFWEAVSMVVDFQMAREWLERTFPGVRHTNAQNFHNALP